MHGEHHQRMSTSPVHDEHHQNALTASTATMDRTAPAVWMDVTAVFQVNPPILCSVAPLQSKPGCTVAPNGLLWWISMACTINGAWFGAASFGARRHDVIVYRPYVPPSPNFRERGSSSRRASRLGRRDLPQSRLNRAMGST